MKTPEEVATEWLRAFADTYLPSDDTLEFSPEVLRATGMSLVHLKCLFRKGNVIKADMTMRARVRCGLWFVDGSDCDNKQVSAILAVRTQEMSVEIIELGRKDEQHANTTAA